MTYSGITLDAFTGEIISDEKVVLNLTGNERAIMTRLFARPERLVTHDELLDAIWGSRSEGPGPGAVKVHVHVLRKKLAPFPLKITNAFNVGYRLCGRA